MVINSTSALEVIIHAVSPELSGSTGAAAKALPLPAITAPAGGDHPCGAPRIERMHRRGGKGPPAPRHNGARGNSRKQTKFFQIKLHTHPLLVNFCCVAQSASPSASP